MRNFYWVWVGLVVLLFYGIAKGLIVPSLQNKKLQALLNRLSVYLLFTGCGMIVLGLVLWADQLVRPNLGYSVALWAAIFGLIVGVLLLLVWIRTSVTLRHSTPLEISDSLGKRFYIVDVRPDFSKFPKDRIQLNGCSWDDVIRVLPHLSKPRELTPQNHIICLDGTWNDAESETNVYRLWKLLGENRLLGDPQIARYYRGVGVNENEGLSVEVLGEKVTRAPIPCATGLGERAIRWLAYLDLVATYQPDDRLFIFGFSRGASSARILANHIFDYGIPNRIQAKFQRAPKYRGKSIGHDKLRFLAVVGDKKMDVPIEMMGLWDTVAAFGLPSNKFELFRKLTIPSNVRKAYHLVAIDEKRWEFDATLVEHDERIEEIWFAGAHTNIGGGAGDSRLSDFALRFMINRASEHGVSFKPEAFKIEGDVHGPEWRMWPYWPTRTTRRIRVRGEAPGGLPRIHKSVFERRDAGIGYNPKNLDEVEHTCLREERN